MYSFKKAYLFALFCCWTNLAPASDPGIYDVSIQVDGKIFGVYGGYSNTYIMWGDQDYALPISGLLFAILFYALLFGLLVLFTRIILNSNKKQRPGKQPEL